MADYQDKVLLIVNTASRCGFTGQYASLQKLYETYRERGFEVLAFPSNNFLGQEPGMNKEIKEFCNLRFNVTFPLFEKINVRGKDIHPLYAYLIAQGACKGSIKWNFTKFLIDRRGYAVERFSPMTDPMHKSLRGEIEKLLILNEKLVA